MFAVKLTNAFGGTKSFKVKGYRAALQMAAAWLAHGYASYRIRHV